jgi:hypothetical protein
VLLQLLQQGDDGDASSLASSRPPAIDTTTSGKKNISSSHRIVVPLLLEKVKLEEALNSLTTFRSASRRVPSSFAERMFMSMTPFRHSSFWNIDKRQG